MNTLPLKGESIHLRKGNTYIIIDALYLNDIRLNLDKINLGDLRNVKESVSPYNKFPFGIINLKGYGLFEINVKDILSTDYDNGDESCFSSDTGLVLIFRVSDLVFFVSMIDYDSLADNALSPEKFTFWDELRKIGGEETCALLLAQDVKSGYDFNGSGIYKIDIGQ